MELGTSSNVHSYVEQQDIKELLVKRYSTNHEMAAA